MSSNARWSTSRESWLMSNGLLWTVAVTGLAMLAVPAGAANLASPAARPVTVKVNRTVPQVSRPLLTPRFSVVPTEEEVFRARVFSEPLVPVGGRPTGEDNAALTRALEAYLTAGGGDATRALEDFLGQEPSSPWRPSLLLSLGQVYVHAGRPSRALRVLREAWDSAKGATEPRAKAVADLAAGELAQLLARLGHVAELQRLLTEVEGRLVSGTAAELLQQGREGATLMATQPEISFRCGLIALDRLLGHGKSLYHTDPRLASYASSARGTTLAELHDLAKQLGLDLQMAKRVDAAAAITVPALVHWQVGHFAALVDERNGRYLIKDPVFGGEMWMSRDALTDEASGYALVRGGALPRGWRTANLEEARVVWGRGNTSGPDPERYKPTDKNTDCQCDSGGMARASVHLLMVSLNIVDTPLRYTPARGPGISFTLRYNQRESFQPQIFSYWNLGSRWTTDWLGYVTDDPSNGAQPVTVYIRGGGRETYTGYSPATASYAPHFDSRAVVKRVSASPIRYERQLPDGSIEEYGQPDGALTSPRKVFLTRVVDPRGDAVSLTYDASLRLVALTDALQQVTTLSYEHPTDPLKLTKVTDPFGRVAQFGYDAQGRLERITDVIDLTSQFTYGPADFVNTLTTPYGQTRCEMSSLGSWRWIEITDPLGNKERVEYHNNVVQSDLPVESPPVHLREYRNTFYWSKKTTQRDYAAATIFHWLHTRDGAQTAGTLESEKRPNEARVLYEYPGQAPWMEGDFTVPSTTSRTRAGGVVESSRRAYNQRGMKVLEIDPVGRETVYVYGTGNVPDPEPSSGMGVDLLQVKQKNAASAGGYDLLASYTYNDKHQVLTAMDAAGQTTVYTYTPAGQVETVTNAKGETTTYTYYEDDKLHTVSGSVPGTTTTYEYDGYGRLWRVTDPEGYWTTTEYDVFDRPTKVTYPDQTWEETVYDKLDAVKHRDRLGRWTQTYYDALQRPIATRDAAGRFVQNQHCDCGSEIDKLVDANGNTTTWERDIQGRVMKEVRANGATYEYGYDPETGQMKSVKDPKGNVKTTAYNLDGTLASLTYSVAAGTAATANVSFTYDPLYSRVATMTDGTGTTVYSYHPITSPPALGAGKLKSVDGPLENDTIEYSYDELGRVTTRQIGSAANTQTQHFDTLGRLDTLTNPLGNFTYGYEGNTGRPSTLTYPNGQQTTWAYYDNLSDRRLREIHNKRPGGATLSRFEYTYDKAGNILTWLQQADADPAKVYELGYDPADQLTAAILKATAPAGQVLKRYYYAYDSAGNRLAEQIDDAVTGASYNNMNQLVSQQAGGALVFKGSVSEPANVTVGGRPATVTADNRFEGQAVVPGGTGQVAVTATDPSGNVRTSTYQVSQGATSKSFTYDANGNMTSDGTRTYEWDAENRLVAVKEGASTIANYTYNARGLRVAKTTGGITASYVLDGGDVVEERLNTGTTTKHLQGFQVDAVLATVDNSGAHSYYFRDHLGSIRQRTDELGQPVQVRDYDPWGNPLAGSDAGGWSFTGREWDREASLYYYRARYYDPRIGRFLAEDPLGFRAGPNTYTYIENRPTIGRDPSGRWPQIIECCRFWSAWNKCAEEALECARKLREEVGHMTAEQMVDFLQEWDAAYYGEAALAKCFFSNASCMKALRLAPRCGVMRPPGTFGAVTKIVKAWKGE